MFKRALYHTILPQLQHKNAIVITGMRQVGKITLIRQLNNFNLNKCYLVSNTPVKLPDVVYPWFL